MRFYTFGLAGRAHRGHPRDDISPLPEKAPSSKRWRRRRRVRPSTAIPSSHLFLPGARAIAWGCLSFAFDLISVTGSDLQCGCKVAAVPAQQPVERFKVAQ